MSEGDRALVATKTEELMTDGRFRAYQNSPQSHDVPSPCPLSKSLKTRICR